jgi:hypothetical protein
MYTEDINLLVLLRTIIPVYCENQTERLSVIKKKFLLRTVATHSYHSAFKVKKFTTCSMGAEISQLV